MERFEYTIGEVLQYIAKPEFYQSVNWRNDFHGVNSYEGFIQAINKERTERMQSSNLLPISNIYKDVAGFAPSVPDYLSGHPEDMINFQSEQAANYHELNFYICLPFSVKANEIRKNGLLFSEWINQNTTNVDRYKIKFTMQAKDLYRHRPRKYYNHLKHVELSIVVSQYMDYMTDQVLNIVCSEMMFRVLMIATMNIAAQINRDYTNGSPIKYEGLPEHEKVKYIDFMNAEKELQTNPIFKR